MGRRWLEKQKSEDEVWRSALENFERAGNDVKAADPSDPNYELLWDIYLKAANELLEIEKTKKGHRWEVVKFVVSMVLKVFGTFSNYAFGFVICDFEATHSMTSKVWPMVQNFIQKVVPINRSKD